MKDKVCGIFIHKSREYRNLISTDFFKYSEKRMKKSLREKKIFKICKCFFIKENHNGKVINVILSTRPKMVREKVNFTN